LSGWSDEGKGVFIVFSCFLVKRRARICTIRGVFLKFIDFFLRVTINQLAI
jgi:hypothetical protein